MLSGDIAIGPGKADLLEGIKETGSIAAAGRRMEKLAEKAVAKELDLLSRSLSHAKKEESP
jgi:molybdate transport system regulatory protein